MRSGGRGLRPAWAKSLTSRSPSLLVCNWFFWLPYPIFLLLQVENMKIFAKTRTSTLQPQGAGITGILTIAVFVTKTSKRSGLGRTVWSGERVEVGEGEQVKELPQQNHTSKQWGLPALFSAPRPTAVAVAAVKPRPPPTPPPPNHQLLRLLS